MIISTVSILGDMAVILYFKELSKWGVFKKRT